MSEKMTNRKRAALETRKKLLETAKGIIREKGLVGTSVEEITKACGVANGTFIPISSARKMWFLRSATICSVRSTRRRKATTDRLWIG